MSQKTDNARKTLKDFVSLIDKKLADYWDTELGLEFGMNSKQKALVKEILLHSLEHNLRPAKRIRAAFTYYSYLLQKEGKLTGKIWNACIALELVHTALLMHDDFMDEDIVRRGKPTTHKYFEKEYGKHYGEAMAVTTGDVVLCLGFELLNNSGFEHSRIQKAMSKMLRGIAQTAYGQAYDVTLEKLVNDWEENDIVSVHKAKTSIYTYENPLFIGAYLAGLDDAIFPILHDYAMEGGIAFQMQDDILGVFGDPEKTGKSADSDLLQGKCTLLVLKLFKEGKKSEVEAVMKVWGKRQAPSDEISRAKEAIISSGSLDYSKKISREYAAKAAEHASRLRQFDLNTNAIDFIEGIAEYMIEREL